MRFSVKHLLGLLCVGALWSCLGSTAGHAQDAFFSFEDGIEPWLPQTGSVIQSSFGATDGNSAMLFDNVASQYKTIVRSGNFGPQTAGYGDAYVAFNTAAAALAAGRNPKIEFDLTWDLSQVTVPSWFQLGMVINSQAGWKEYGTGQLIVGNADPSLESPLSLGPAATTDGVTFTSLSSNSARVAIPFGATKTFDLVPNSTYYDIWFRSNGGWEGSLDLAVDNFRFSGLPQFEEYTLFSWETPDDLGTPGVNEQLEGWMPNPTVNPPTHSLSITSTGATEGNSALQLDRTALPDGFTWGSVYALDAETNPSDQTKIDDLVSRINGATQIAVDITFQDDIQVASPTYSNIWLAFTDDTGAYYQAGSPGFDVVEAINQTTQTLIWDLSSFDDFNSDKILSVDGLAQGTQQLAIVLGTATDGGSIYQLDNFRLISEVADTLPGDFDEDGDVDGRDFLTWQRNPSVGNLADWQDNYGNGSGTLASVAVVPEPAALSIALLMGLAAVSRRRIS